MLSVADYQAYRKFLLNAVRGLQTPPMTMCLWKRLRFAPARRLASCGVTGSGWRARRTGPMCCHKTPCRSPDRGASGCGGISSRGTARGRLDVILAASPRRRLSARPGPRCHRAAIARPPETAQTQILSDFALAARARAGINAADGQLAEWSKAHAWKVCRRGTVSRVRIPHCPP